MRLWKRQEVSLVLRNGEEVCKGEQIAPTRIERTLAVSIRINYFLSGRGRTAYDGSYFCERRGP